MQRLKSIETGLLQKQSVTDVLQISVFKNFAVFTGTHLCWSFFLIKLQALINVNHGLISTIFWYLCVTLFKVSNRSIRRRCGICSKLIIKTPERCQVVQRCSVKKIFIKTNFFIGHLWWLLLYFALVYVRNGQKKCENQ